MQFKSDNTQRNLNKSKNQLDDSIIKWNAYFATLQEREIQLKKDGDLTDDANRLPNEINNEIIALENKLKNSDNLKYYLFF